MTTVGSGKYTYERVENGRNCRGMGAGTDGHRHRRRGPSVSLQPWRTSR